MAGPEKTSTSPIIIANHTALAEQAVSQTDSEPMPSVLDGGGVFSMADLTWLAARHPRLMQTYLSSFNDPAPLFYAVAKMRSSLMQQLQLFRANDEASAIERMEQILDIDGILDLTTAEEGAIRGFMAGSDLFASSSLHVIHNSESDRYRVELHRMHNGAGNPSGAWRHSTLRGRDDQAAALRDVVTARELQDVVFKGGSLLYARGDGIDLMHPRRLLMKTKQASGQVIPEFWFPQEGQTKPNGSSASVLLPTGVRERIRVEEILRRLELSANKAVEKGKVPTLVLDLDGTLFNARTFTVKLFKEWLAAYDGPDADDVRAIVSDWEMKNGKEVNGWNGMKILMGLGVTREATLQSSLAYHNAHFYDPKKRVEEVEPIWGMVNVIKLLRRRLKAKGIPLETLFISLRTYGEDPLADGESASRHALRGIGLWDDHSHRLFLDGDPIDYSMGVQHEAQKWEMLLPKLKEHPDYWVIAAADNTANHLEGYLNEIFGHKVTKLYVLGDQPDGAADPAEGVIAIDPIQAQEEIGQMGGVPKLDFDDLPQILMQPAYAPMVARLREAQERNKESVVIFDIDDSLVETAPRAHRVLQGFLAEWVKKHPEKAWILDQVAEFTPSQVEYGVRETLVQAGLDGLGIEQEFQNYFLKHFLSNDHLGEDRVRPAAAELAHALKSIGVRIAYLTGRTEDMREGTLAQLMAFGFPLLDNVKLKMRRDPLEADDAFKARVFRLLVGDRILAGFFDNEPGNLDPVARTFRDWGIEAEAMPLYLVGDRHMPNASEPPAGAKPIADFRGQLGHAPKRVAPTVGAKLRKEGQLLGREIWGSTNRMWGTYASPRWMDYPERHRREVSEAAVSLLGGLKRLVALDPAHASYRACIEQLNASIGEQPGRIERFEDMLDEAHKLWGGVFVPIRGVDGIHRIVEGRDGIIPKDAVFARSAFDKVVPLALPESASIESLSRYLSSISAGPALQTISGGERFEALAYGALQARFPRLDLAMSVLMRSALQRSGKSIDEIRTIVYDPRLAFGEMIAAARVGAKVQWRENNEARRLQTERAIESLPHQIQERISFLPEKEVASADVAIWNLPPMRMPMQTLGADVVSGGLLVVQSQQSVESYQGQIAADAAMTFEPLVEVPLDVNDYVLPSAFLHVGEMMPISSFQVWAR